MKILLRLLICLACFTININQLSAQQSKLDSFTVLLESHTELDTNRVRILNRLAYETCKNDATAAKPMALEALELARSLNDVRGQSDCHFSLVYIYLFLGEMDNAIESADLCRTLSAEVGNIEQVADAYYLLGYLSVSKGDIEKGKAYYQSCIDVSQEMDYVEGIGKGSKGLGDIFETEGDYTQARLNYELNLRISLEDNSENGIMGSYNDLGRIADAIGDYDKALEYFLLALPMGEKFGKNNYSAILSNIGTLYTTMKNYPKALEYLNEVLEV